VGAARSATFALALVAGAVATAAPPAPPATAAKVRETIRLAQLPGRAGCLNAVDENRCVDTTATAGITGLVVSPDGRHVYAAIDDGAVVAFRRDRRTGALKRVTGTGGCVSDSGRGFTGPRGSCTPWRALEQVGDVAISPDGRTIYAATLRKRGAEREDHGVAVLRRERSTGRLRALECWTRLGGQGCKRAPGDGERLVVTPDGRQLIVGGTVEALLTGGGTALSTFAITADGRLSDPSCSRSAVGPEGACAAGPVIAQLNAIEDIATSPDGTKVVIAAGHQEDGQLMTFTRDPQSGALTAGRCLGDAPKGSSCPAARALADPELAVAPDGRAVYVASGHEEAPEGEPLRFKTSAITAFTSEPFAQVLGRAGCVLSIGSRDRGCARTRRFRGAGGIAVTPDGTHALATFYFSGAVVLLRRDPATQALRPVGGAGGCLADTSQSVSYPVKQGCGRARGLQAPSSVVISPDGRNAYVVDDQQGLAVLVLR